MVQIHNPLLDKQSDDHFHHLGITKSAIDIPKMYGDIKFICMGGSMGRIKNYAKIFAKEMGISMSDNLSTTDRYSMYKTGQVLWVNHGIGSSSSSIVIVELIKLLYYAKAKDVIAIRMGTAGGIGVTSGTLILTSGALNGELLEEYVQYIMGEKISRPAIFDAEVYQQLYKIAVQLKLPVQIGKTLSSEDFYEGQARLDGAFCEYTEQQKLAFLNRLHNLGVRNIEMESLCFAALFNRGNIRAAVVCVALLDRLKGDQVLLKSDDLSEFETRVFKVVNIYIKQQLKL
ncbi:uridine phosphorylase [Loa loa]|uniref:Uridine phosphorylase n=1 Tax=Loa loa TaxID=7209 RepID=A0A1S0TWY5_LOALO|nr:uridine phosphorylase [Loa loa]EFO21489.1 uridine phosphorylase [Loa loa]